MIIKLSNLKIFLGIFLVLAASRFVPHPPNFTALIALSFYIPLLLGRKFIPALLLSFIITDYFIGFHSTTLLTWGSVILIGIVAKYFNKNILFRLFGALVGSCIFFIVTNFGVWILGSYGYTLQGFLACYILAIPFFTYNLISTVCYSVLIESIFKLYKFKKFAN